MKPKNLTIIRDDVAKTLASLRAFPTKQVLVGIPADADHRGPDPNEPSATFGNAQLGYLLEFGSPAKNIPARPHLKPGVAEAKKKIIEIYRTGAKAVASGRVASLDSAHIRVGLAAVSSVRHKIQDGPFAPLAPATIAGRKARGRKSEKPLVDTGQYRNSITFVVRQKGAR